jgi:hypothetical protein
MIGPGTPSPRYDDISRRSRYTLVVRALLSTALLVGLYFTMPLDGKFSVATVAGLVGGLAALSCLVAWHARSIARARYPRLRAIAALTSSVPLFLILYAAAYYLMSAGDPKSFSESLTRVDALYFTVTVFSTVGFGDIWPRSEPARILVMTQMFGDLLVIGLVAKIFTTAVGRGLAGRGE